MLMGTLATALLFAGRQGGTYSYVIGGVFGISSLGMLATSFGGGVSGRQKRVDLAVARGDYLRQLGTMRDRVRDNARRQRIALSYRHPAPADLWSIVDSFRLWERRASDGDFGVVRVGAGVQNLATPLIPPADGVSDDLEPISSAALRSFLATYAVVPDLPVSIALAANAAPTAAVAPSSAAPGRDRRVTSGPSIVSRSLSRSATRRMGPSASVRVGWRAWGSHFR